MRTALRQNRSRRQVAASRSIPAPVGGWDTESPLADMPPQNAIMLVNWIPRAGYVEARRGFEQQVSGTSAPVESLVAWRGDASGDKLLACAGSDIYDVTTAGALGSALWGSATSARWDSVNFANDAGAFAIMANGADAPLRYDGAAVTALTITGSSGPITLDPTDLRAPMVHKRRIWMIETGTLRTWFLPVNAIQGAAQLLDLGPLFAKGGVLRAQATWSLDGGAGIDDVAVFVSSEGQVAVYQGIDPTDADNWSQVGVYDLANPLGERCLLKYGADLAILTEDGFIPLSQALDKDRTQDDAVALTAKIATAFSTASALYKQNYGWQALLYPGRGSLAIINIPTTELSAGMQFVQSMQTGAWCKFTGINAICWAIANGEIYFGGESGVFQWDVGATDNGATITYDLKPAFNSFGSRIQLKQFTMLRALLKAPSIVRPALEMLTDYRESIPVSTPTVVEPGDISEADADAIRYDWTSASTQGYVGAPRMRLVLEGDAVVATLGVDATDTLAINGDGDNLLIRPNLPLDVPIQLIGFDIMFLPGGQI